MQDLYLPNGENLDKNFLVSPDDESVTYNDVEFLVEQYSEVLISRTLAFIVCSNTLGSYLALPILVRNGVVPLLLDSSIQSQYLNDLIDLYEPDYLFLPSDFEEPCTSWKMVRNLFGYKLLKNVVRSEIQLHSDLCIVLTTSGTTGNPKMVRLSNRNVHSNALAISNYLGISSNDRVITTLPMNYSYGLSVINSHFVCGSTIFLSQNSITDRKFWESFRKNSITTLNGVPRFYEMLVKMRFSKMDLPSLRIMTQAGGKLSDSITRELLNYCVGKNILFYSMYGQTEASPRMSFVPPSIAINKVGSIGIAIPGGKLSLWDRYNTEITSENTVGELCYTGENVFMGYAEERSDLSKGHTNDGFLRTGDLALRDSDGFFTIVGRLSRFAKVFGLRINLDDLERHLKTLQSECACIGEQEQIVIFATNHDALDDLRDAASIFTGLSRHAFVSRFLESIPTTESGKVKYAALE